MPPATTPPRRAPAQDGGHLAVPGAIVTAAGVLVPGGRRREWLAQWNAELAHYEAWLHRLDRPAPAVARLVALRALGAWRHALALRARHWSSTMLLADLRLAIRTLLTRRAFTAVAVLTVALGIAANATVFTWVEAVLLRPLPGVPDQGRLYTLHGTTRTRADLSTSYPNFRDMREALPRDIGTMTAYRLTPASLRGDGATGSAERAWATLVSGNYFDVLGIGAAAGRLLTSDDDRTPGGHAVAVLGHAYWQRRFGGDPSIVGRTITLNGQPFTVVGVSAPAFRGTFIGLSVDLFVPMMMQKTMIPGDRLPDRGHHWLKVLVRLAPGADREAADAALRVVAARLAQADPRLNEGRGVAIFPLWSAPAEASGFMGPVLAVLAGVVAVVLLIACANVANLLLARATSREREVAIRLAIGASRGQVVRQMLVESVTLAALGAAGGVLVSHWASRALTAFIPPTGNPIDLALGTSPLVVAAGAALGLVTGLVFGLVPALQFSRPSLVPALREGVGASGPRGRARLRHGLVVLQVALSLLLLVTAGLFVRTLREVRHEDLGFSARHGLLASMDLAPTGWTPQQGRHFYREVVERVGALPGVAAAALASDVPLGFSGGSDTSGRIEGYTPAPDEEITLHYNRVGPGYFEAFGVPLLRGRDFTARDESGAPGVVIINETMARRYWKGRDAIGGRVTLGERTLEVIGIARDGKYRSVTEPPRAYMYLPLLQFYGPTPTLHVRTEGDPEGLLAAIRREVASLAPDVPLFETRTYAEHREFSLLLQRLAGSLLGIFGGLALLLASIGLYGVLAYIVGQRRREMGVRMALGATPREVVRLVVAQGMRLVLIGTALGLGAALLAGPLLASQLVGVSATDPLTYGATLTVLMTATLVACTVPALRAAHVDPVTVLRNE
jgi:predicted permease